MAKTIGLFAIGSFGDVYPIISLGIGFKNKGYNVIIITYENFYNLVKKHNLECIKINKSFYADISKNNKTTNYKNPISVINELRNSVNDLYEYIDNNRIILENFDLVIISGVSIFIYPDIIKKKIPYVILNLSLNVPESDYFSPTMLGTTALGWNGFIWKYVLKILWKLNWIMLDYLSYNVVESRFKKLNIPYENYRLNSKVPIIYSFSKNLINLNLKKDNEIQVGYLNFEDKIATELPKKLIDFINNSNNLIYIGFGSMLEFMDYKEPIEITIVKLIKYIKNKYNKNLHVITYFPKNYNIKNISIIEEEIKNNNIYFLDQNVSHIELFKKCDIIVHHGGIGTCHASICSGKFSIIIPHAVDQPFNASLLTYLNLGVKINEFDYVLLGEVIIKILNNNVNDNIKNISYFMKIESEESITNSINFCENFIKK